MRAIFESHRRHSVFTISVLVTLFATSGLDRPLHGGPGSVAWGQTTTLPDSTAASFAPGDSTFASADSTSASADSTLAAPGPAATADSLGIAAPPDSLGPGLESPGWLEPGLDERESRRLLPIPPWARDADLRRPGLDLMRPGVLAEALDALPGAEPRIAGDNGAPAFLSLGPISGPAPEILLDGTPSRSPADLDPAIWDRSFMPLVAIDANPSRPWQLGGDPFLVAQSEVPLQGRTLFAAHFYKEAYESFLRGVSVTTPRAPRIVRFDFEEWKTEDGYNFTTNSALDGLPNDFGRSKMRRFRLGADVGTGLGRLSLTFGRGRRFYRGTVLATGSTERWTGEVVAGLDREDESSFLRVRGYHLDWHVDDAVHAETRSGVRLGVRALRVPKDGGFGVLLNVERWAATFASGETWSRPDPRYMGRLALSHSAAKARTLQPFAAAELGYAEHASEAFDVGGTLALRYGLGESWAAEVGAVRRLRTPTLLETDGLQTRDYANGARLLREGAGPLPFERQDRAYLGLSGKLIGIDLKGAVESWRLGRGIGWRPAPGGVQAETVGDLDLTVNQVTARAHVLVGDRRRGIDLTMDGHQVLGSLGHAEDRGAGWPLWAGRGTVRLSHQLINQNNRIFLEVRARAIGPRFDDMLAPFDSTQLPAIYRYDLRAGLRVRDAELYMGWFNLADEDQVEVLGTRRRPRQFRWGLHWPFYN